MENDSDDDKSVSGDEFTGYQTEHSVAEFEEEIDAEKNGNYDNNEINIEEAYDVENANDIWENE
jgi:hypothetical protein